MTNKFVKYVQTLPPTLEKQQQEELLIEFYKTKDKTIRKKLIEHNLRLCAYITINYCQINNFDSLIFDMYSESIIALTKALDTYNPFNEKNASFATYAGNGINFALLNFYVKESKHFSHISSDPLFFVDDENTYEYFDLLADEDESRIAEQIIGNEFVKDVLNQTTDKNRLIVKMYLGIGYNKKYSQHEIAQTVNLSQSNISKTLKHEFIRMKKYIAKNYPLSFPDLQENVNSNSLITKLTEIQKDNIVLNPIFDDYFGITNKSYLSLSDLSKKYKISTSRIKVVVDDMSLNYIEQEIYTSEDIDNLKQQRESLFKQLKMKKAEEKLRLCAYLYYSYYGLNGYEKKSQLLLSKELNTSRQVISIKIKEYENYLSNLENIENVSIID